MEMTLNVIDTKSRESPNKINFKYIYFGIIEKTFHFMADKIQQPDPFCD